MNSALKSKLVDVTLKIGHERVGDILPHSFCSFSILIKCRPSLIVLSNRFVLFEGNVLHC